MGEIGKDCETSDTEFVKLPPYRRDILPPFHGAIEHLRRWDWRCENDGKPRFGSDVAHLVTWFFHVTHQLFTDFSGFHYTFRVSPCVSATFSGLGTSNIASFAPSVAPPVKRCKRKRAWMSCHRGPGPGSSRRSHQQIWIRREAFFWLDDQPVLNSFDYPSPCIFSRKRAWNIAESLRNQVPLQPFGLALKFSRSSSGHSLSETRNQLFLGRSLFWASAEELTVCSCRYHRWSAFK